MTESFDSDGLILTPEVIQTLKEVLSTAEEFLKKKPQSEARLCGYPHSFTVLWYDGNDTTRTWGAEFPL